MPVIILGGIYGGIFTPTEAAAVSVVTVCLWYGDLREVKIKDLFDIWWILRKTTGGIMLIVASASLFSLYVPNSVSQTQLHVCLEALHITSLPSF